MNYNHSFSAIPKPTSRRIKNWYPQYNVLEYDLASVTEEEIEPIKSSISDLVGLALLPTEPDLRRKEWQQGADLEAVIDQRFRTASGLARHNFWKAFDSHFHDSMSTSTGSESGKIW